MFHFFILLNKIKYVSFRGVTLQQSEHFVIIICRDVKSDVMYSSYKCRSVDVSSTFRWRKQKNKLFLLPDLLLRLGSICVWFPSHIFPFRWAFSKGPIHMEQPWRRPSLNLRHPPKLRSETEPRLQLFQKTGIITTGRQSKERCLWKAGSLKGRL